MKKAENQILVIFGASGDLTHRKLLPALFELYSRDLLPEKFQVIGAARTPQSTDEFRNKQQAFISEVLKISDYSQLSKLADFLQLINYIDFDTDDAKQYQILKEKIIFLEEEYNIPDNIIYYLAAPPAMYDIIPVNLQKCGMNVSLSGGSRKIIIEKPFGYDLESAQRLNHLLESIFHESEIFRIDHYLGKETVQNILVLRFSNGIFEPLWNRNYIDFIEIISTETLGVENRGKYYDIVGALRDMVQNHLMQLMAFIAMEPPATFDPESIRDEIAKVFKALHVYSPEERVHNIIRGQYMEGDIDEKKVIGYRREKNVAPNSNTETYITMKLMIDNWRWGGIPFFIYTGKRLKEKRTEIIIHFKSTP